MDPEEQRLLKLFGVTAPPEGSDPEEARLLKLFSTPEPVVDERPNVFKSTWDRFRRGGEQVADVIADTFSGGFTPSTAGMGGEPSQPRGRGRMALDALHGLGEMAMPSVLAGEVYGRYAAEPMARGEDISDARIAQARAKAGPGDWLKSPNYHLLSDWDKVMLSREADLSAIPEGPERTKFWVDNAGEWGRLTGELLGGGVSATGLVKQGTRMLRGRKVAAAADAAVEAKRATGVRPYQEPPVEITPPVQGPQRPVNAPDWTPPVPETISPAPTPTAGLTDRPTILDDSGRPLMPTTRTAEEVATARVPAPEPTGLLDEFGKPIPRSAMVDQEEHLLEVFKQADEAAPVAAEPARPLRRAGELVEERTGGPVQVKPELDARGWQDIVGAEARNAENEIQRALREGVENEPLPEGALKPGEEPITQVPSKATDEAPYASPGRRALRRPISGGSNGWIDESGKVLSHSSEVSHDSVARLQHGHEGVQDAIDKGWVRVADDPFVPGSDTLNLELADNPNSIKNAIRYIESNGRGKRSLMIDLQDSAASATVGTPKYHSQGPFDRPWKAIEWLKSFLGNEQGAINPSKTGPRTLRELRNRLSGRQAEGPTPVKAEPEAPAVPLKTARQAAAVRTEEIVKRPVDVGSVQNRDARRLLSRDMDKTERLVTEGAAPEGRVVSGFNLDTINSADDVERIIANVAEGQKELIERARGPKKTEERLRNLAEESGLDYKDLMIRNKKTPFSDVEVVRYKQLIEASATNVRDKLADVTKASGEGYEAARNALREAIGRHAMVAGAFARGRAQVGRALRAFQTIPNETIDDLIPLLKELEPNEVAVLTKLSRHAANPRLWDKLMFGYVNALLTSPVTHTVNISSNTLVAMSTPVEKLFQGKFGEAVYDAMGMYQALKGGAFTSAVKAHASRIPMAGMERYQDRLRELGAKFEAPGQLEKGRRAPFTSEGGKTFQKYAEQPGRALAAEDDFFRSIIANGELYAQGLREAKKQGVRGRAQIDDFVKRFVETDATDEALIKAWNEAKYRTFNQKLGKFGQIMLAARKAEIGESGIRPLEFLLPFVTTPTNITKYALERSPLGFMSLMFKANRGEKMAETLAKPLMGSAGLIMAYAAMYAVDGNITGRGPSDPAKREVWLQNHTPYSLEATVGGKRRTISFERIEPIATVLGAAADVVQASKEYTEGVDKTDREYGDIASVFLKGLASVGNNMLNKTYFQQLTAITNALSDPDRFFDRLGTSLMSAVQPVAFVSSLARAADPYKREVSPLTQPQSEIPGASRSLRPQLDPFGKKEERPGGASVPGFIQRLLSPAQVSTKGEEPLFRELERAGLGVGKGDRMLPSGKRMSAEQFHKFEEISGNLFREKLSDVVDSYEYQEAESKDERKALVSGVLEAARREAREQLVEDGVLPEDSLEPRSLRGR